MPDNDTLLAYLVSSFPGNTENIATEALRHIFDHSDACGVALNDVIQSGVRGVNAVTTVKTQVIQEDGVRPDLVGFDETGVERVLIEVKFWAGLTDNQPNGYIRVLPDDGPALLMFLVPGGASSVALAAVAGTDKPGVRLSSGGRIRAEMRACGGYAEARDDRKLGRSPR